MACGALLTSVADHPKFSRHSRIFTKSPSLHLIHSERSNVLPFAFFRLKNYK